MKKILPILFLFSNVLYAQVDTVSLRKIRWDFAVEGGAFYGQTNKLGQMPWRADIFANSVKNYGLQSQFGLQFCFFNKFSLEIAYSHDQFQGDKEKVVNEMRANYTNYFIQEESVSGSSGFYGDNNCDIKYFRFGLSGNIRLNKSKYLQPYAFYAIGQTAFPKGEFAFKENSSNNFYINQYSFDKMSTTGFVAGIRYKYFADGNTEAPSPLYSNIGIKLEFAYMNVDGKGQVLSKNGLNNQEALSVISVNRNFRYVTLGVFFGFGSKGKKYANSFLFSTYPIEKRKTLMERLGKK